jgi:hypothetical protein
VLKQPLKKPPKNKASVISGDGLSAALPVSWTPPFLGARLSRSPHLSLAKLGSVLPPYP